MSGIDIIGMGPGDLDYLLPIAYKKIQGADILIGGQRNLDSVKDINKERITLNNNLNYILNYITEYHTSKKIAILVSGDPGFHSLLNYLRRNLIDIKINVIPGISSVSYLFSKIGEPWQDAILKSLHGEEIEYIDIIKEYPKVVFLTDTITTPKVIAKKIINTGLSNKVMIIGESLSYKNEKISTLTLEQASNYNANKLCIVVVKNES